MPKEDTLTNYLNTFQIEWASELPAGCPPENILVPENDEFYRLVINSDKITEEDLKTKREINPNAQIVKEDPVFSSGLSVSKQGDFKKLTKLPSLRKRYKGLAKFVLNPTDGVLLKSGSDPFHYTWWRTTLFDLEKVEIIQP